MSAGTGHDKGMNLCPESHWNHLSSLPRVEKQFSSNWWPCCDMWINGEGFFEVFSETLFPSVQFPHVSGRAGGRVNLVDQPNIDLSYLWGPHRFTDLVCICVSFLSGLLEYHQSSNSYRINTHMLASCIGVWAECHLAARCLEFSRASHALLGYMRRSQALSEGVYSQFLMFFRFISPANYIGLEHGG